MTGEDDVRRMLSAAVRGEPPLRVDRDAVLAEGRRRLRARRTATVGGAALAVAALVVGMTALSGAQFGMRDPVGPAAPNTAPPLTTPTRTAEPSTAVPTTVATTPTPPVATTRSPTALAARKQLEATLREAKIAWPLGVAVEADGREWYTFDDRGTATFWLVDAAAARRMVTVGVYAAVERPEPCGTGCSMWPAGEDVAYVRTFPPSEAGGPTTVEVTITRAGGEGVRVTETSGYGPPWRPDPVLPQKVLIDIAALPGFAVKR